MPRCHAGAVRLELAGVMQGNQGSAGGVGIASHACHLSPAAIGKLLGQELLRQSVQRLIVVQAIQP